MARAQWPLNRDRPVIEIELILALNGQKQTRTLLADTGAGNAQSPFDILLDEHDCLMAGVPSYTISLGGAYTGAYAVYTVPIEIPLLGYAGDIFAVGVPTPPVGLDGIAGFRFLNRFTYGNFGDPNQFGLEP
jgi:hypothetical protein